MVQIHVKQSDESQFLYDCLCTSEIDKIASDIIQICNLQTKIQRLVFLVEEHLLVNHKEYHPNVAITLKRALSEAKTYASKEQVLYKKPLSAYVLQDHIQSIEREVKVSPLQDSDLLQQLFSDEELLLEDMTQLWWAGKELARGKRLHDYVGKNEKTKISNEIPEIQKQT